MQSHVRFTKDIMIGDEAAFHLNGRVNNYEICHYALRNNPASFNFKCVLIFREKVSLWMEMEGL